MLQRKSKITIILLSSMFVSFVGCTDSRQGGNTKNDTTSNVAQEMTSDYQFFALSDSARFEEDFRQALLRGDKRFIGVMGFTVQIPGVPDSDENIVKSYGVKIIEGTSDSYDDSASHAWQLFCVGYAKGYNELLLDHIRSDSK